MVCHTDPLTNTGKCLVVAETEDGVAEAHTGVNSVNAAALSEVPSE